MTKTCRRGSISMMGCASSWSEGSLLEPNEAFDLRIGETIKLGEYDLIVGAAEGSQKTYDRSHPSLADAMAEKYGAPV